MNELNKTLSAMLESDHSTDEDILRYTGQILRIRAAIKADKHKHIADQFLFGLQEHVYNIMESVCGYNTPDEPRQSQFEKLFNIVDRLAEQCYPILKKQKKESKQ